jgi:hypothetical protein
MSRKILSAAVAAIGVGLVASVAMADSYLGVTYLQYNSADYSNGDGGEFNAAVYLNGATNPIKVQNSPVQLAQDLIGNFGNPYTAPTGIGSATVFQTFCIQNGINDVTFQPGAQYYAEVQADALTHSSPPPEYLSAITQVLFAEFWNGSLPGYVYTEGTSRSGTAGELQQAIWSAQGDLGAVGSNLSGVEQTWYNDAAQFVLDQNNSDLDVGLGSGAAGNATGYTNVQVLALYSGSPSNAQGEVQADIAQAQLVELTDGTIVTGGAPVPLPSVAGLTMAMLSMVGLFGLVRRVRKHA